MTLCNARVPYIMRLGCHWNGYFISLSEKISQKSVFVVKSHTHLCTDHPPSLHTHTQTSPGISAAQLGHTSDFAFFSCVSDFLPLDFPLQMSLESGGYLPELLPLKEHSGRQHAGGPSLFSTIGQPKVTYGGILGREGGQHRSRYHLWLHCL